MKLASPKDLTKRELDYAVAVALKVDPQYNREFGGVWYGWTISTPKRFRHLPTYHNSWQDCGPIMAELWVHGLYVHKHLGEFFAEVHIPDSNNLIAGGSTPQEAILRLYVLKALGTEVSIPLRHLE